MPLVQGELRRLARKQMARERRDHLLQPTALVNEAFLRLIGIHHVEWRDRVHFLSMCARLMRRVLIDLARARDGQKHGRGVRTVALDEALIGERPRGHALLALDEALKTLSALNRRTADVVELKFFGGLSVPEIAEALGISPATVMRDWKFAKAWLMRELADGRRR